MLVATYIMVLAVQDGDSAQQLKLYTAVLR